MRRLSIVDIAGGHQPVMSSDQRHVLIFNGEIVNHLDLREELSASGHRFLTHSDTETLLAAYRQWGDGAWPKLEGMFAAAIWDRSTRELTLARDPLGIKPLYVAEQNGGIAFASELKGLHPVPGLVFETDPLAVHDFFSFGHVRAPRCIYRDIQSLPPGHILRIGPEGEAKRHAYWQLRFRTNVSLGEHEWIEAFREIWLATVKRHLLADVPVGSFLSGGVDSSAVTAAMARVSSQPITAFTIGFPDRRFDETPYASEVARHLGCEHVHEVVDLQRAVDILPQIQKCYDEPFADSSAIPLWYVSRLAARRVKVVLAGDGGDEVFAGYRRHHTEALVAQLSNLPGPIRRLGAAVTKLPPLPFRKWNYLRQRAERVWASSQLDDAFCRFFEKTEITAPGFREKLYLPQFLQQLGGRNDYRERRDEVFGESGEDVSENSVEQLLFADTTVQLPSALLTKVDRASMAHSLEVRVPFLSHKLVEWAATVPLHMKLRGSTGKYLVRKAVEPWLPKDILRRPKHGFQAPLADWFVGGFGNFAREIWFDSGAARAGYLVPAAVESAFREHQSGVRDHSNLLYALAQFGLWWGNRQPYQAAIARTA